MDDISFSAISLNVIHTLDFNTLGSKIPHIRSIRTRIENVLDILQQLRKSDNMESPGLVEANLAIELGQSL